jgi:CBS domain-containing protein
MPATTLVREVMTPKVMTLRPDQAIADAADEMAGHKFGAMPVVDDTGKLLGLLRDEDFIVSEARVHVPTYLSILGVSVQLPGQMAHVQEELRKVAGSTVGEVMEADPLTITPDDTLEDLATAMHEKEISHVPVVDADGMLVGIVARGDIVRFIARTT